MSGNCYCMYKYITESISLCRVLRLAIFPDATSLYFRYLPSHAICPTSTQTLPAENHFPTSGHDNSCERVVIEESNGYGQPENLQENSEVNENSSDLHDV